MVINGSAVTGAPKTYTVTVSITDNPIVSFGTVSAGGSGKDVHEDVRPSCSSTHHTFCRALMPIGRMPSMDVLTGRALVVPAALAPRRFDSIATGDGLGGYVWPSATPASVSAVSGMSCPAVATGSSSYTCSATSVTAGSATAGAAAASFSPSVTVTDTANTATPAATVTTDPASTRTDKIFVNAPPSGEPEPEWHCQSRHHDTGCCEPQLRRGGRHPNVFRRRRFRAGCLQRWAPINGVSVPARCLPGSLMPGRV